MNLNGKILLSGEELADERQRALLPKLKSVLQGLMEGKGADLRILPLVRIVSSGCWEMTSNQKTKGYKEICVNRKKHRAHRFFYEKLIGPIRDGLMLDHLCRNRGCVNPLHLEQVTNKENAIRGVGWAGQNYRKTHCNNGHEFNKENTGTKIQKGRESRMCLKCKKEADARWLKKNKAKHNPPQVSDGEGKG